MTMPRTSKEDADSIAFFGMWSPVVLFPVVLIGTNEARCAYCLCLLVAILSTDAMSPPAAAALPFVLFMDMGVEQHPLYFKIAMELLHQIAVVLLLVRLDGTSLMCRVALYAMALFGTRVRTLLCGCVVGGAILTMLTNSTTAVLLMAAVADNMVQLLQNEVVQALQQRALFDKATDGMSSLRRRLLEDMLWPRRFGDREAAATSPGSGSVSQSPSREQNALPFAHDEEVPVRLIEMWSLTQQSQRQGADREALPKLANSKYANSWVLDFLTDTKVTDEQLINREASRASAPNSTDTDQETPPRHSPPKRPTAPSKSSLLSLPRDGRCLKKTSILEDGQLVVPGQASPERKGVKGIDPYRRSRAQHCIRRCQLQRIIGWRKERYQTIHKHLLMGAVVASSLTNMLASSHSSTLRNVIGYLENRFRHSVMTNAIWWTMLLPAQLSGIVVFWLHLKFAFLNNYDAPDTPEAQITIKMLIQRIQSDLGLFRFPEFIPATLLLTWVLANSLTMLDWRKTFDFVEYPEHLDFDYVTAVLAFALPWVSLQHGWSTDFRSIARRLPWGAFFLYFSSLHVGFAVKEFGMGEWIARRVRSITAPNLSLSQMVLTSCSVFLTEMMGNVETVSVLMPIVVDVAIGHKCHPLYFAVPVLVGASTSVVSPMGSMALALANSITDMGAKDTMAAGLLIKATTITVTLFMVNTVGCHIFNWSEVPPWLHTVTTAATSTNQTYEIDLLPL